MSRDNKAIKNFQINPDGIYELRDFLHLHDRPFLHAAYMATVRRSADEVGESYYLSRLRTGVSRETILAQMLKSPEAKKYQTTVKGITPYVILNNLMSIPFLGGVLAFVLVSLNIKKILKDARALENHLFRIGNELTSDCGVDERFFDKDLKSK